MAGTDPNAEPGAPEADAGAAQPATNEQAPPADVAPAPVAAEAAPVQADGEVAQVATAEAAAAIDESAAESTTAVATAPVDSPTAHSIPLDLPDFGTRNDAAAGERNIDLLSDVELNVKIELGRAEMLIEDVLKLGEGSVVELDKLAGDPVDVLVNDRLVARGEVLVLNDNFCVRINEIVAGTSEALNAG
jgi:flagellar motor switch protein FliN/FliY